MRDTIAAIATGLTPSGIGIVRVSGSEAISIVNKIFSGADLLSAPTHTMHYGLLRDGETILDEVMVALMRAPRTYTREDTVEIDSHGSPYILKKILETVLKHGARLADPGEFTKRAFLNGRIDLTEAESVMELIGAKNEFARKTALSALRGATYQKIKALREALLFHMARIESALDDPEHYDLSDYPPILKKDVAYVISEIRKLLLDSENGRLLTEGIRTVIVGKPNVGKSSLLNFLLGEERAIVTDVEGTTRDMVEQQLQLHGLMLTLIDTAGIRDTKDEVERIGVDRAKEAARDADLVLFMLDGSRPLTEEDKTISKIIQEKQTIVLLNKSDLPFVLSEEDVRSLFPNPETKLIFFSTKEEEGLDLLEKTILDVFFDGIVDYNSEIIVTNVRQKESLLKAERSLTLVGQSIEDGMPEDFYSIDLMDAYAELGRMIGEQVDEDLVNEIFDKFCMGK